MTELCCECPQKHLMVSGFPLGFTGFCITLKSFIFRYSAIPYILITQATPSLSDLQLSLHFPCAGCPSSLLPLVTGSSGLAQSPFFLFSSVLTWDMRIGAPYRQVIIFGNYCTSLQSVVKKEQWLPIYR